jgi:hypothetical protein
MLAKLAIPDVLQVPSVVLQLLHAGSQADMAERVAVFLQHSVAHVPTSKSSKLILRFCLAIFFAVCAQKTEGDVRSKKNGKFLDLRHIHLAAPRRSLAVQPTLSTSVNVFTHCRSGRT